MVFSRRICFRAPEPLAEDNRGATIFLTVAVLVETAIHAFLEADKLLDQVAIFGQLANQRLASGSVLCAAGGTALAQRHHEQPRALVFARIRVARHQTGAVINLAYFAYQTFYDYPCSGI